MMALHVPRRWLLVGAVIAGALLVVLALRPSPLPVDVARVESGPLMETVDEEGQTRVRDRFVITAPVTGELRRIQLREGDSVVRGQVVASLEPAPLDARGRAQAEARLEAAEDAERVADAALAAAVAAVEQAKRTRARADSLAAMGLLAPEEREKAELAEVSRIREREGADFKAQAAAHDVEAARGALLAAGRSPAGAGTTITVRAPVAGRVLRLVEQSERVVLAGAPLLEVGDPKRIEVVADFLSSDAVKVHSGDTMLIEEWGGGRSLLGRVRMIEPSGFTKVSALGVEEQRVNVVGDFQDDPGRLGDRFRVEVRVVLWRADTVLQVPSSALFRQGERWYAFVVEQGRIRRREVEIGHRGAFDAEVLRGLNQGDVVVRHPSDKLADGVRVRAAAGS